MISFLVLASPRGSSFSRAATLLAIVVPVNVVARVRERQANLEEALLVDFLPLIDNFSKLPA
jgi:hypothetical protein